MFACSAPVCRNTYDEAVRTVWLLLALAGCDKLWGLVHVQDRGDMEMDGGADSDGGNNGCGTQLFAVPTEHSTGLFPAGIAVADVNRDGQLDIVVANQMSGTISVFLGLGA